MKIISTDPPQIRTTYVTHVDLQGIYLCWESTSYWGRPSDVHAILGLIIHVTRTQIRDYIKGVNSINTGTITPGTSPMFG